MRKRTRASKETHLAGGEAVDALEQTRRAQCDRAARAAARAEARAHCVQAANLSQLVQRHAQHPAHVHVQYIQL